MIGSNYIIRDLKHNALVIALVIDTDGDHSKRVRIQTGEHAGEVLHRKDFQVVEVCPPGEAPVALATAWAETWME